MALTLFVFVVIFRSSSLIVATGTETPSCGDILATVKSSEIESFLVAGIDAALIGSYGEPLKSVAIPLMQYGVQVRKICAACTDFETAMHDCDDRYGSDISNSGLLIIPLEDDDSENIAAGNHKVIVYNHGTTAVTQPSSGWAGEYSEVEIILNLVFASTSRSVVIMADYMGQGESFGKLNRGYIVRESYVTSVVPLLLKAGQILDEETACSSRLSDSVLLMGYSEGGYASLAVAEKLNSMGLEIIQVRSGGAPFWLSSAELLTVFESVIDGTFPSHARYFLAYLGFGFSSSRDDMVNFEMGQDMLTSTARQNMLDFIAMSDFPTDEWDGIDAANALVPSDDMLSIYDPGFVDFIVTALAENDTDPCTNRPGNYDLVCQALQGQDLHTVLQNASYPVSICHSPDDEIVSFLNVPDISDNPYLSLLSVSGGHEEAVIFCTLMNTQYVLSEDFRSYQVLNKTNVSCFADTHTTRAERADTHTTRADTSTTDDASLTDAHATQSKWVAVWATAAVMLYVRGF